LGPADFVSLDEGELYLPRRADGGLPAVDFMYPAHGSALIDAGVNAGLPFQGAAPDIGAFEQTDSHAASSSSRPIPQMKLPVVHSALVPRRVLDHPCPL
jgi:hypothetical protein